MERTQASGSVSIDMSHVAAGIQRAAGEAIGVLAERMGELKHTLDSLAASSNRATLNHAETIATLSCHLPAGLSTDALGDGHRIAQFQAERLAAAGYALVAVAGPALEHAVATGNVLADFTSAAKAAAGVRVGPPVTTPPRGGTIHLNGQPAPTVEYVTAEQRADDRLAQARRDGAADSWFEED